MEGIASQVKVKVPVPTINARSIEGKEKYLLCPKKVKNV